MSPSPPSPNSAQPRRDATTTWDVSPYPAVLHELLTIPEWNALGPGRPRASLRPQLSRLTPESLVPGQTPRDLEMARCCLSGLWLLHDFLDESHSLSQEIDTTTGSYWHGIMHRREPDAWNSKYWFRKVGRHPVIKALEQEAPAWGYEYESAAAFVDFCEAVRGSGSEQEKLARRIQWLEWQRLFDFCFQAAWGVT